MADKVLCNAMQCEEGSVEPRPTPAGADVGRQASQPAVHHRLAASLASLSRAGLGSHLTGLSKLTTIRCVTHRMDLLSEVWDQNGALRLKCCAAHHLITISQLIPSCNGLAPPGLATAKESDAEAW